MGGLAGQTDQMDENKARGGGSIQSPILFKVVPSAGSRKLYLLFPQRIGRKSYGKFNLAINEDDLLTVSTVLMWSEVS